MHNRNSTLKIDHTHVVCILCITITKYTKGKISLKRKTKTNENVRRRYRGILTTLLEILQSFKDLLIQRECNLYTGGQKNRYKI